jgi:enoyl-CoA hydratase
MARPHGNLVKLRVEDGVAVLTLDNGKVNGYSHEMMLELDDAILAARFDDAVHVIVLTGARDVFCAGADTAMLGAVTPRFKYFFCLHANETLSRLEQTPKLVIAALNGHTVGGGLEIALAADLRLGIARTGEDARAPKIGLPEVNLGVLPGTGGTQRMVRAVGKSAAIEWMTRGDNRSFAEAKAAGLIQELLPAASADEFRSKAIDYAREFCPPRRASKAVGLIKRACQTGAETSLEVGLALERELQQQLFQSDDAKEGIAAFNEKRSPSFRGK